jgi:hypothetical protein
LLLQIKVETLDSILAEDYASAEVLDAAARQLWAHRRSLAPPTADDLQLELQNENSQWNVVYRQFIDSQDVLRQELLIRQRAERRTCEMSGVRSLELDRLRKREKELALAKRFREARDVKDRADDLQMKLAMAALLDRQREQIRAFDELHQQVMAFIDSERGKSRKRLMKGIAALGRGMSSTRRRTFRSPLAAKYPWKQCTRGIVDGATMKRYCAGRRTRSEAHTRGRWID